jgi:hypothetical protein
LFVDLREPSVKCLGRRSPAQRLARSAIERCGNGRKGIGAMCAEIADDAVEVMMAGQPGVLDLSDRYEALSAAGDPLERLSAVAGGCGLRGFTWAAGCTTPAQRSRQGRATAI